MKDFRINVFDELVSTNSHALSKAGKELFDGDVIVAKAQRAGRGRMNRNWVSPQGNLYFSLILQPKISLDKLPQISFVAAVALRLVLQKLCILFNEATEAKVENKWPNDVLINQKKVAGILLESELQTGFVVLGIGVNLVSNPENVLFKAGNLKEFFVDISPQELLENFLKEFDLIYQNYLDFGFKKTRNLWLERAFSLNKKIKINLEDEVLEGVFIGVDELGNLLLQEGEKIRKILTCDIL